MSRERLESSAKITADHLARQAYVYVRQSSPRQVQVRIPRQGGHRFHGKLDTDSTASWTPIPGQAGHPFQGKLDG